MAAPSNPFAELSTTSFSTPDEEFDPIYRTPAFKAPRRDPLQSGEDLEDTPLRMEDEQIVQLLNGYFDEAENARETGYEPRHEVWEQNLHAFWMRKDFPDKMEWQSREKSSYVPNFVERFAAVHREALSQNPDWVKIDDRADPEGVTSRFATKLTRLALDFAGTNCSGQPVPFEHNFGNMVRTGALMKMCVAVVWDPRTGRVVTEEVDPRQCYHDPTGRGIYRVRFWETDKETLLRQAELLDSNGEPIYDREAIEELCASRSLDAIQNKQDSSGAGQMLTSARTPILIKEWLVDLIDQSDGKYGSKIVRERQLIVTANDYTIIRGPERNPYWHGKDWIVAHPILQAPLAAVDGRTYVELFRQAVETHENVTNRILDAVATSSMNAFEVNPEFLDDPEAVLHGIAPNQTILKSEDAPDDKPAVRPISMGNTLGADIMNVWQATRKEAQEAGAQSDISLGSTTRGETTATEASLSNAGQSSLNNSISTDIDLGFLGPVAELVYYTALQHVSETSLGIWSALDPQEQAMLEARRDEFRQQPITVRANGLTSYVQRTRRLRGLLGAINVIGGNPILLQEFMKEYSAGKLIRVLLEDFGVQLERIELSPEQKFALADKARQQSAMQSANEQMGPPPGGAGAPPPGGAEGAAGEQGPTSQMQGGQDPLAQGVPEGLPGGIQ